jgi:hypothetical protein
MAMTDFLLQLILARERVVPAFAPDTAAPGFMGGPPSTGHCVCVAVWLRQRFGGDFVSAKVNGCSHWFNRISLGGRDYDFDLTADQFSGGPNLLFGPAGSLYEGTRVRSEKDLLPETLERAARFVARLRGA